MTKIAKVNTKSLSVHFFASKAEAQRSGNDGLIVGSQQDLADNFQFTNSILVGVYNGLTGKSIQKFQDRATGVERVWAAISARMVEDKAKPAPSKASTVVQGQEIGSPGEGTPRKARKSPPGGPSKARKGSARAVPMKVVGENPYRVGSKSHSAFEIAKANTGKTFREMVTAGARANTLAGMMREKTLIPE